MFYALISLLILSALSILSVSCVGVWKLFEIMSPVGFVIFCIAYFGLILSTLCLLTYTFIKVKLVLDELKRKLNEAKVKLETYLSKIKKKLEKVPNFVWDILGKIFK